MRVALITEVWQPSVNGVITRLNASIDGLLAAGHRVLIIAPRTGPADARVPAREGVTVVRVPAFRIPFIYGGQPWGSPLARVRPVLAAFRPDIVHVVSPFVLGIPGVRAARSLRLPLVASFHTDIAAYARTYHLAWSTPFIWGVLRGLHNAAQLNIVTSRHSESLLGRHGIRNVVRWRPGVDLELFRPHPERAETRPPVALYVGRLAGEKRLDALLPLARSGLVALHLVGDGPDRRRLESALAGTATVFHGTLTGDALAAVYESADVFVFPSTTETLGLVLIEALASGLPVVAATSPASRELLSEVDVARLVPTDRPEQFVSAVADVLAAGTRAQRSSAARRYADGWGWPAAAAQLLEFYEGVLAESRPAQGATRR